jgi:alkanesulfonate monooxygenase SsuD/methylene tetrahydromethanopterin reductase-like flavin-dependent oxidoreductase (luciferase family)
LQNPLPLLIGGGGEKRTMRVAAVYAYIWHAWVNPAELRHKNAVLDEHCASIGRDPAEINRATGGTIYLSDNAIGPSLSDADVAGSVSEVIEQLRDYAEAGADEFIVRDHSLFHTTDHALELIEQLTLSAIPAL